MTSLSNTFQLPKSLVDNQFVQDRIASWASRINSALNQFSVTSQIAGQLGYLAMSEGASPLEMEVMGILIEKLNQEKREILLGSGIQIDWSSIALENFIDYIYESNRSTVEFELFYALTKFRIWLSHDEDLLQLYYSLVGQSQSLNECLGNLTQFFELVRTGGANRASLELTKLPADVKSIILEVRNWAIFEDYYGQIRNLIKQVIIRSH